MKIKIAFFLIATSILLNSCNISESSKLEFKINQSLISEQMIEKQVIGGINEPQFEPIIGTIRIGDQEIPGILGGFTCTDSKCIDEEHLIPPLNIQISPPSGCIDSRCIEMPIEVSLPFINLPPDYICQYAICTEVYYENLMLAPYRMSLMMLKPLSCTDAKCVDPNTKHGPDGPQETDSEKKRRKEQIEDAKNKEKTEAAEKEAKAKKEAKEKAEKEKKESEESESKAEKNKKDAEHSRKQEEYKRSRAKEKYDRERQNNPDSDATQRYQSQYNDAQRAEQLAINRERQTIEILEQRQSDRILAEREYNTRVREYNEAQARYEWNVEADRTIRRWRDARALCNSIGCDFKPIGLKQP